LQALVAANVPQPPSVLEGALQAARSLEEDADVAQQENLAEVKLPDQTEWEGYSLGDVIFGGGMSWEIDHHRKWPGSIAGDYAARQNKKYNSPGHHEPDWKLVRQLADEHCKGTKQWKGLAVHVRAGDVTLPDFQEKYYCTKFIPPSCYEDAIKLRDDVWELVTKEDGILVVTGNHFGGRHLWWKNYSSPEIDEQRERKTTNLVTNVLATLQKQTNKPIEVASTTPDNDFCTLYKASHFMSGPGGFSEAISGARNHHYGESPFHYGWWKDKCSSCSQYFQNGNKELFSSFQQGTTKN